MAFSQTIFPLAIKISLSTFCFTSLSILLQFGFIHFLCIAAFIVKTYAHCSQCDFVG